MAVSSKKRQKRIEKKKAKRKAKRNALTRQKADGASVLMRQAASAPVLHCCTSEMLWEQGMANLLFSRRLPDGRIAVAMFLVDAYCLGIKDALAVVITGNEYREKFAPMYDGPEAVELTPAFARKIVEGAVAYARDLGFSPHSDYHKAAPIFGDVDPDECDEQFEFGKDGKPFFFAGPNDRPAKCNRILRTLESTCGPGGFDYAIPADNPDLLDLPDDADVIEAWDEE